MNSKVTISAAGSLTAGLKDAISKLEGIVLKDEVSVQEHAAALTKLKPNGFGNPDQIKQMRKAIRKKANKQKILELQNAAYTKGKK